MIITIKTNLILALYAYYFFPILENAKYVDYYDIYIVQVIKISKKYTFWEYDLDQLLNYTKYLLNVYVIRPFNNQLNTRKTHLIITEVICYKLLHGGEFLE